MKLAALLLFAAALQAQTLINSGGAATGAYMTDQGFVGGSVYGPNDQQDAGWKNQVGVYSTLRYGSSFSYDVLQPNGTCSVKLLLLDNRPAVATPSVPASGVGLRVFTVTANGVSSGPIDIFALAGAQTPYALSLAAVPVTDGHLRLSFLASRGNAVLSGLEITCQPILTTQSGTPKFITETFPINSGAPAGNSVAFTLSKTPVPDMGMLISFQSDNAWWQSVVDFIRPDTSKTVNVKPPSFSGTLKIAYWSLD